MFSTDKKSRVIQVSNFWHEGAAEGFLERLKKSLHNGISDVILNCSDLDRVTSMQIGALLAVFEYCSQKGISCRISSPKADLRRMIKVLDLGGVLLPSNLDDETTILLSISQPPFSREVTYKHNFTAGVTEIQDAKDRLIGFLRMEDWPESIISDICTIFYEISTNIRLYGVSDAGNNIEFSIESDKIKILMRFSDSGPPFDPTRYKAYDDIILAAKNGKTRGFGIILVRKLTDRMEYKRENGTRNILCIEKRWACGQE